MYRPTLGIGIALLFFSVQSYAQQGLAGKYEATYSGTAGGDFRFKQVVTLEITSAENGKIAGKFHLANYDCRGDYLIEGTYQDGKLDMRTNEGAKRGCGKVPLALVSQGNKLVGTYDVFPVEFSKQ